MNNKLPKVSIVLPTFNGASKYLKASIDSCLNQSYACIELIIVDDCSTDNTQQVVNSYADPRIVYIRNATNQRLPKSLNIGFDRSTGDYLTWTSDDNEFLPQAIEEMLNYLKENKDVDFVYTDLIVRYFETGKEEQRKLGELNLEKENNVGACYLYTRKVYETLGGYDPRFEWVEDYDYWIRVAKKFQVRHLARPLYIYGDHVMSLTHMRRFPIVMMRDILRYRHGYLSLAEFMETIRQFTVDVRVNITDKNQQAIALRQVFNKAFGISFAFGMFYVSLFSVLGAKKVFNILTGPLTRPVKKIMDLRRVNKVKASLKVTSGRINVLCVIPELTVGGSEKVIWDIVNGLSPRGYDFHLICNKKDNNAWCREFSSAFKNTVLLDGNAQDDVYDQYLDEMVRALHIKIILNTNSRVGYRCLPKLKAAFKNLKAVDVLHLEDVGGAIPKYAWAAQHMERRICISEHLREYMTKMYDENGISKEFADRLDVVYNGTLAVDQNDIIALKGKFRHQYAIPADDCIVSFVGRLAPEKMPFLFIDIAMKVLKRAPHKRWKFVMAGSGPYASRVRDKIQENRLEDHFILPGMLADLKPLLADTFLLLVVSRHEGIPLVIQEAMAMNVPVLSTNVGAIRELLIDGVSGHLISLDDNAVDCFADRIIQMSADPQMHRRMTEAARGALFPKFSMEQMHQRYQEIFDGLLVETSHEVAP